MDAIQAIETRHSVRSFKPQAAPRSLLEKVLTAAIRAPSWANTQQWEFAIVGGSTLEKIKDELAAMIMGGVEATPDIPWPLLPEPYNSRRRDLGLRLFQAVGIERDDKEKRRNWELAGYRMFGATACIIFYLERTLSNWALLDLGILMENVMLAAHAEGLGTIAQAAVVRYPQVLRSHIEIPPTKKVVMALAVGYPDPEHPANKFRSPRLPLSEFARWYDIQ